MTDIDWSERIDQAIREYPEVGEYLEAIRGNVEALASRLAAVEELHQPVEIEPSDTICGHCSFQLPNGKYFGKIVEYPCDDIKAVRGE